MVTKEKFAGRAVLTAAAVAALSFLGVMFSAPFMDIERPDSHYWGARIVPPGPASNGLPIVPVQVGPGSTLEGGPAHLSWYAYSGREAAPGLAPDANVNNTFYYHFRAERLRGAHHQGIMPWWEPLLGRPMRASDFPAEWAAAPGIWRSTPTDGGPTELHVWVMRVDKTLYPEAVGAEFASHGFLAFAAHDTFMGCEVSWELTKNPVFFANGQPLLADSCHHSRYDPRDIRPYSMPPGDDG